MDSCTQLCPENQTPVKRESEITSWRNHDYQCHVSRIIINLADVVICSTINNALDTVLLIKRPERSEACVVLLTHVKI
jgi:hypothetical protein